MQFEARDLKSAAIVAAGTGLLAVLLSWAWRIPYIYTVLGVSVVVFVGHAVTIDDDLAGGWSNPEGLEPFPWRELVVKAVVMVVLGALAFAPAIRAFGR